MPKATNDSRLAKAEAEIAALRKQVDAMAKTLDEYHQLLSCVTKEKWARDLLLSKGYVIGFWQEITGNGVDIKGTPPEHPF